MNRNDSALSDCAHGLVEGLAENLNISATSNPCSAMEYRRERFIVRLVFLAADRRFANHGALEIEKPSNRDRAGLCRLRKYLFLGYIEPNGTAFPERV